jgi:hypothetical protein
MLPNNTDTNTDHPPPYTPYDTSSPSPPPYPYTPSSDSSDISSISSWSVDWAAVRAQQNASYTDEPRSTMTMEIPRMGDRGPGWREELRQARRARNRIPAWIDGVEALVPGRGDVRWADGEGDAEEGAVVRRMRRRDRRSRGCSPSIWVVIGTISAILVTALFAFGFVIKALVEGKI